MKKWIKLFVIALGLISAAKLTAQDCKNNIIFCKIIKYNPNIDKNFALSLANKLVKKAKEHGVDPNLSLAILMQESGLRNINTYKTHTTVDKFCDDKKCYKIVKEVNEAFDLSIAQININTARNYGLDIDRLFNKDLDYALDAHFIILKDKMKTCAHLGADSYSCYHSTNEPHRLLYVKLVSRYLN